MHSAYAKLLAHSLIGGVIMYLVMFAMIDRLGDFYNNLNMAFMAVMMVAPMIVLMVLMMPGMYPSRPLNLALMAGSLVLFVASFTAIRSQGGIGDQQFLRSMIPHHSGAILMCEESAIRDPRIIRLCGRIIDNQKQEIAEMKEIMANPLPRGFAVPPNAR